jgi:hypothetical protein
MLSALRSALGSTGTRENAELASKPYAACCMHTHPKTRDDVPPMKVSEARFAHRLASVRAVFLALRFLARQIATTTMFGSQAAAWMGRYNMQLVDAPPPTITDPVSAPYHAPATFALKI